MQASTVAIYDSVCRRGIDSLTVQYY